MIQLLKRFSKYNKNTMTITIRDIAKKLNLSIAAVSRAMDGYPDISEETRERVVQTAKEMGYVPNQAARHLRRKKADAIGYVLPSHTPRFADPFFTEFIAGLGDETARHPFDLTISIAPPGEEAEKHLYQSWVQGHKVDGFILTHLRLQDWRVEYLSQQGIPFTALENTLGDYDFPLIDINRQAGIIELVAHLAERGFRWIACIGGPANLKIQMEQFDGYCQGLGAVNIPFESNLITLGDLTSIGGYQATKRLLSIPDPPDAIICINDETAFGVLHAAHEAGLQVGKDLAVAGFDGVQLSKYTEPPLTTLDIPVYDIACRLVKMLVAEIAGQPLPERQVVLRPKLLIRESTGGNPS
jgi:LacI family transcriptional regulator